MADLPPKAAEDYAEALKQHCVVNGFPFLDIRTKMLPGDVINVDDHVHFNDLGNRYNFEMMAAHIGNLPQFFTHYPNWDYCELEGGVYDRVTSTCIT